MADDGVATAIRHVSDTGLRINGGFFAFRTEIFDYMREGEELVEQPFGRLIAARQLLAYSHDGFWACMDTFKDKSSLDELAAAGNAPWEIWKPKPRVLARRPAAPPRYSEVA
jgi:glucose-1-phosphate cytidylyltransferase